MHSTLNCDSPRALVPVPAESGRQGTFSEILEHGSTEVEIMRFLRRCTFLALLATGNDEYVYVAEVFGQALLIVGLVIADLGPAASHWLKAKQAEMPV